jgi:VCBS repeat-containing protein
MSSSRLRAGALGASLVSILGTLLLAAPAGASLGQGPYAATGTIAAYDADGQPMNVGYYDRIGDDATPQVRGQAGQDTVAHVGDGPGPEPFSTPNEAPGCELSEDYPWVTVPPLDCYIRGFAAYEVIPPGSDWPNGAVFSPAGTYGVIMPPFRDVDGSPQVFDHWNVTDAITAGKCSAGEMGNGNVDGDVVGGYYAFARGPEYRLWVEMETNSGLNATVEAHYAKVSPDTSAPIVTIAPATDCAVVEQNTVSLLANFTCEEPGALGSGVASCVGRNDEGEVADGEPLDTSTTGTHAFTVTGVDNDGNARSQTMHYTVVNSPPTALSLSNNVLDEDLPAGTDVGTFHTTDPGPGAPFTYELVDGDGSTDNASFTIAGDKLKTASSLAFETKPDYAIRVRTTDDGGSSFEQTFTVHLIDMIEVAPAEVAENQPAGTVVGTVGGHPVGPGPFGSWYELVAGAGDTDNGSFVLYPFFGNRELTTAASFDFETKSSYSIRVGEFWEGIGGPPQATRAITIHVTDVNEPPTGLSLSPASVAENQAAGTTVGSLSTTDPDAGDAFTYSLVSGTGSTDNGSFTIDGATLKTNASFDYETKNSYSVRVQSTDQGGRTFSRQLTVTVTNVGEGPTVAVAPGGACLSDESGRITLTVADPDTPATGLSLARTANSNPALVPNSGVTVGGAGANRSLTVNTAKNKSGTATLTLAVSDGTSSSTIPVTVRVGTGGSETLNGGGGTDMIFGLGGVDTLSGGGSIDLLCSGAGNDALGGGDGADTLDGGSGEDALTGGDGADILRGNSGADRLTGGAGVDAFDGGSGSDRATDRVVGETLTGVELLGG